MDQILSKDSPWTVNCDVRDAGNGICDVTVQALKLTGTPSRNHLVSGLGVRDQPVTTLVEAIRWLPNAIFKSFLFPSFILSMYWNTYGFIKIGLTPRFSDNLPDSNREKPFEFVLQSGFYLIPLVTIFQRADPSAHEDTPCASCLLGCRSSAFPPVCVRVPTGSY